MVCVCVLADMSYRQVTVSRQESQISVKSSSSVELGSLSNRSEVCVCACSQVYHIKHTGKNMKLLQPSMCTAFTFCTRSLYYLLSLSLRTAARVLKVQIRTRPLERISTAVCFCLTAQPVWHRLEPVWLCETCWAACVRKEASPWKTSWSTSRARIRSHTHCPVFTS